MRSRKGLALILALSMILTSGFQVHATESEEHVVALSDEDRDLVIEGGVEGTDYTYEEGVVTILTSTPLTIRNADINTATNDRIMVYAPVSANVTFAGVNIYTTSGGSPFALEPKLENGASAHITLADGTTNTLVSAVASYPGLRCGRGSSVTIDDGITNRTIDGRAIVPELGRVPYDATLENGSR